MKKPLILIATIVSLAACNVSKKSTSTAVGQAKVSAPILKPSNGIYDPDTVELKAIQQIYADINMSTLKEGFVLYAYGPCVSCHNAKNIYEIEDQKWKGIIDDMAESAKISSEQKEAVFKYVLAIKAAKVK